MRWVAVTLILALLLTLFAVIVFLPTFFLQSNYDGWSYFREVDKISSSGGDIVVRENRQTPSDKGYITMTIEPNLTTGGNLAAYVNSRTDALNFLLDTVNPDSVIEAVVTFKEPMNPEDFASLCETSIEKLGEYATIVTDKTTGAKNTKTFWYPRPQEADFVQNITSVEEGYRLEGIIAFECYIKAETARSLQSDPKVLIIDPLEDLQVLEIKKNYELKGFYVQTERPFFKEMWAQYVQMEQ